MILNTIVINIFDNTVDLFHSHLLPMFWQNGKTDGEGLIRSQQTLVVRIGLIDLCSKISDFSDIVRLVFFHFLLKFYIFHNSISQSYCIISICWHSWSTILLLTSMEAISFQTVASKATDLFVGSWKVIMIFRK